MCGAGKAPARILTSYVIGSTGTVHGQYTLVVQARLLRGF